MHPFHAVLTGDPARLRDLRRSLSVWLEAAGVPRETRDNVVLATHEAAANAIEHAGSGVAVSAELNGRALAIAVTNDGDWKQPSADERRGRGLILMRALMSEIDIHTESRRTTVRMSKQL